MPLLAYVMLAAVLFGSRSPDLRAQPTAVAHGRVELAGVLIKIVMHGLAGPTKVQGKDYGLVPMPPMGLDDQQLAEVLTFIRSAYGNQAPAVKVEQVKAVREATKGRTAPWTATELGK